MGVAPEGLHQCPQQQFFVGAVLESVDAREVEVRGVDIGLRHAADLVLVGPGGADDRLRRGSDR